MSIFCSLLLHESSVLITSRQSHDFSVLEKCKKTHRKQQAATWPLLLPFGPDLFELPEDWSIWWYTWLAHSSHTNVVLNLIPVLTQQTPSQHSSHGYGKGHQSWVRDYSECLAISIGTKFLTQKCVTVPSSVLGDRTSLRVEEYVANTQWDVHCCGIYINGYSQTSIDI